MLDALCSNLAVREFLGRYPRAVWTRCVEAVAVIGISSAYSRFGACASIEQLEQEAKRLALCASAPRSTSPQHNGKDLHTLRTGSAPHQRARHRPLIMYPNLPPSESKVRPSILVEDTPRFHLNDTPKSMKPASPKFSTSPCGFPKTPVVEKPTVTTPRKLPKYLENVESKIRPQVKRDVDGFRALMDSGKKRINLRKSSSFGDLAQWSESLIGPAREDKENELLTEPNVSMCRTKEDRSAMLAEPNTSLHYADRLQPFFEKSMREASVRGTAKFKPNPEPSILSLADQFLNSPIMQLSARSYHLQDFISTTPSPCVAVHLPEAVRTAPLAVNSRYESLAKDYEIRRNDFVRRLSSISSISSVIPEDENQRKSPTPQGHKATPSSRTNSFPWMDSSSPNTSFYDREDVRNPMCRDSLLSKFL